MIKKGTQIESVKKRIIMGRVKKEKERWRIVGEYVEKNVIEGALQTLKKWIGEKEVENNNHPE